MQLLDLPEEILTRILQVILEPYAISCCCLTRICHKSVKRRSWSSAISLLPLTAEPISYSEAVLVPNDDEFDLPFKGDIVVGIILIDAVNNMEYGVRDIFTGKHMQPWTHKMSGLCPLRYQLIGKPYQTPFIRLQSERPFTRVILKYILLQNHARKALALDQSTPGSFTMSPVGSSAHPLLL